MGAEKKQLIGSVSHLCNGGDGLNFDVVENGQSIPAFAIRFDGVIRAYKNRCGHIAVNLDMKPGRFFTEEGDFLVCSTHGALYEPGSGACTGGPCFGIGLEALAVTELDGSLYLDDNTVALKT
ncbi:MAG: Rieske (2Fe-2S) protein [Arenicella sp.]